MNAVDTNVLVYCFDDWDLVKQSKAQSLLKSLSDEGDTVLLWQAAGELLNQLTRWHHNKRFPRSEVSQLFAEARAFFPVAIPTPAVLDLALDLSDRYSLSHWDSMLLGACIDAGVTKLYTEDIGAPRKIDSLELVNPF